MIVKKESGEEVGSYFIEDDGQKVAEMTFAFGPNRIIIQHTEVSPEYRGQRISKLLVEKAIDDARKEHFSLIPICQVARKYFEQHPEAKDVL